MPEIDSIIKTGTVSERTEGDWHGCECDLSVISSTADDNNEWSLFAGLTIPTGQLVASGTGPDASNTGLTVPAGNWRFHYFLDTPENVSLTLRAECFKLNKLGHRVCCDVTTTDFVLPWGSGGPGGTPKVKTFDLSFNCGQSAE